MNIGSKPLTQQVAARFSAAADNYHSYDVLQKQTARRLLKQIKVSGRLLDIGAGPGTCFAHLPSVEQVICLDIAEGMLSTLTANYPHYQAICADAQNLPLLDNSVDGIYSNVALQWCQQLPQAVTEANRVLTAGAEFNMSIVAKDSLQQLSALGFKINQFIEQSTLLASFDKSQWDIELCETQAISLHFDTLKSMLQSIKGVGASIVKQQQDANLPQVTLRGRKDWQALQAKAELSRAPEGLPLTYNICFIKARKKR